MFGQLMLCTTGAPLTLESVTYRVKAKPTTLTTLVRTGTSRADDDRRIDGPFLGLQGTPERVEGKSALTLGAVLNNDRRHQDHPELRRPSEQQALQRTTHAAADRTNWRPHRPHHRSLPKRVNDLRSCLRRRHGSLRHLNHRLLDTAGPSASIRRDHETYWLRGTLATFPEIIRSAI